MLGRLLLLAAALSCATANAAADDEAALNALAQRAMITWHQPGLGVAFVRLGEVPIVKGYGVRRLGNAARVDSNTLFGLGSCSKAFGAATIGALVDRGRLGWDDRVVDRVPWFRARDPGVTSTLTIRDILANRAGLKSDKPRESALSPRDFLASIAWSQPMHPFRAQFGYANDMFTLAGEVARRTVGTATWAQTARALVWAPAGLTRTNADHRRAAADSDSASPHQRLNGVLSPIPWLYEDDVATPSGGVNSTPADMARWLTLQLDGGRIDGRQILSVSAVDEMHKLETRLSGVGSRSSFDWAMGPADSLSNEGYALGWFVHDYRGTHVVYHEGSIAGFRCFVGMLPERGWGVAILANADSSLLGESLFQSLVDRKLGISGRDWIAAFNAAQRGRDERQAAFDAKLFAQRTPAAVRPLARYAGHYSDQGAFGAVSVDIAKSAAVMRIGRARYTMVPSGPDRFQLVLRWPYPWGDPRFATFEIVDGRATAVSIGDDRLDRRQKH